MSHTETLKFKVSDAEAFVEFMQKHGFKLQSQKTAELNGVTYSGHVFKRDGYLRPIILTEDGDVKFDIWNGNWGDPETLGKAFHEYAAKTAEDALVAEGYTICDCRVDEETGELVIVGEQLNTTQEEVVL